LCELNCEFCNADLYEPQNLFMLLEINRAEVVRLNSFQSPACRSGRKVWITHQDTYRYMSDISVKMYYYTFKQNGKLRLIVLFVSDVFKCIIKQLLDSAFA
jgi:hypothetical protein